MTAFSIGAAAIVLKARWPLRLGWLGFAAVATAVAWRMPDPLAPVRYVEGVFALAWTQGTWAAPLAVLAAALPAASLACLATHRRSEGIFAVALYYAALLLLAPLQVTPVPLLGFGAGPIIGYFIVLSQLALPAEPGR